MAAPTPEEQLTLELINRARSDPAGELDHLILDRDTRTGATSDITGALNFFDVDMDDLYGWFVGRSPVPPLAWSSALNDAATGHSQMMIDFDEQSHKLPGEPSLGQRISNAGYSWNAAAENIFAFTRTPLHGHAGFYIDWGNTSNGIQDPPGHRISILSTSYRDIGIGIIPETDSSTGVGPLVQTQNFARKNGDPARLTGVAIDDLDDDQFYDTGEGLGGVTVEAAGIPGTFSTTTWASGGYTLPVPNGTYTVTFSGGAFGAAYSTDVAVTGDNVKIDAIKGAVAAPPPMPTEGDDDLTGFDGSGDVIGALGGHDLVSGLGGNDTLAGDGGNDTLVGGAGDDRLTGGDAGTGFGGLVAGFSDFGQNDGWSGQTAFPRLLGDVDGDGDDDIVGFGLFDTLVALSNGDGSFQPVQIGLNDFSQAQGWSDLDQFPRALADVNDDGFADIVGFGLFDTLVALSNGDGSFQPVQVGLNDFSQAQGWSDLDQFPRALGDVNGDGSADIVGFGLFDTLVALSNGDGTFQPVEVGLGNFSQSQGWSDFDSLPRLVGDVSGDGKADIVGFGLAQIFVAHGQDDGSFAPAIAANQALSQAQGWTDFTSFPRALGDISGDGRADILGFGASETVALFSDGTGFAGPRMMVADFSQGQGWSSADSLPRMLGDVDGSGAADIVGFTDDGPLLRLAAPDYDRFDFADGFGMDVITDFDPGFGGETIGLAGIGAITDYADLMANHLSQDGPDVVIDDLAGNSITLENTAIADLHSADFDFGP